MINKSGLNRPLNNCWIEAENCISNTKAVWFFVCFSYPTCPPWKSRAWFHVCSTYTLSSPVLKRVTRRRGITTHFPYPSLFPRYCRCGWGNIFVATLKPLIRVRGSCFHLSKTQKQGRNTRILLRKGRWNNKNGAKLMGQFLIQKIFALSLNFKQKVGGTAKVKSNLWINSWPKFRWHQNFQFQDIDLRSPLCIFLHYPHCFVFRPAFWWLRTKKMVQIFLTVLTLIQPYSTLGPLSLTATNPNWIWVCSV